MSRRRRRSSARRSILIGSLVSVVMLVAAGHVRAAGPPLSLGAAAGSEPPSVAVNTAGDALVVWSTASTVKYCVLPRGGAQCANSGTLTPSGGENEVGSVTALADVAPLATGSVTGNTFTILADVFGAPNSPDYGGVQAWTSTDDGATFVAQDNGDSVSSGYVNGDTVPVGGVVVPGAEFDLGFGYETAVGPPTFNVFNISAPTECSIQTCPQGEATLEPASNPDQVGNLGAQFGSNGDGVLGIFQTNFTSGPLACKGSLPYGVAYVFGENAQSASNDYDISPGLPNSAWHFPVTQALCNVEYPALSAGVGGFGVLAQNDLAGDTIYARLGLSAFDSKPIVVDTHGEQQPSVSQDGAGNVYATFLSGGSGGAISLAFARDRADTFTGPAPLDPAGESVSDLTSDVNYSGHGWAAWLGGGAIHAQSFEYTDAVAPAAISPAITATATTVTVGVACSELPCTVNASLTLPQAAKSTAKPVTLGAGTIKTDKTGSRPLVVRLNPRGRRTLATHRGATRLNLNVTEKAAGATITSSRSVRVSAHKTNGRGKK